MGSIHTTLEEEPDGFTKLAAFYAGRVRGGVGLIVTSGIGLNDEDLVYTGASKLTSNEEVEKHRIVTDAVHTEVVKNVCRIYISEGMRQ